MKNTNEIQSLYQSLLDGWNRASARAMADLFFELNFMAVQSGLNK